MTHAVDFHWKIREVNQYLSIPLTKNEVATCRNTFKAAALHILFKENKGIPCLWISLLEPQKTSISYQFELNHDRLGNSPYPPHNHPGKLKKIQKAVSPLLSKPLPEKPNLPPAKVPLHLATSVYDISPEQTSPLPAPSLNTAPPSPLQLPEPVVKAKTNLTQRKSTKSNKQRLPRQPVLPAQIKNNTPLKQPPQPTPTAPRSFCHKIFEAMCHILTKIISFIRGEPLA